MGAEQRTAFEAAAGSGNTIAGFDYFGVGLLFMILFLWAAWAAVVAYKGWAAGSITPEGFGGAMLRVLLIICVSAAIFIN